MAIRAELNSRDKRFLDMSLNAPMWKVVLYIGTPLALYQGLAMLFTILDTMMASHISKESVSAVAYLAQLNLMLSGSEQLDTFMCWGSYWLNYYNKGQIIEIDGFEVTVSFTDEARPEVFQRVKQILLSSAELKSDMDAA